MPSDSYKISGTVERIFEPREGGQKTYQTVVIKTPGQYSQVLPVEFGEKCLSYIKTLREGERVEIDFSLRGREWNGKYFASLSGFKITGEDRPQQRDDRRDDRREERPQRREEREPERSRSRTYHPPDVDSDDIPF